MNAWEAPTQISQWKEEHVRPQALPEGCILVSAVLCSLAIPQKMVASFELMPGVLKQGISQCAPAASQVRVTCCISAFERHPFHQ